MKDPIINTPSHEAWAKAATDMKQLEPIFNRAHLLNAALSLGQPQYGGKAEAPFTDEQREALTKKYYEVLMSL